jgi:predicted neutral ceramidase superfamily lipid hydrolase
MTATLSSPSRQHVNPIHIAPLFKWLTLALILGAAGLMFVYVKNQQHLLGSRTRDVEKKIVEMKAYNEVLLARISALSSRAELQRKLDRGVIALRPIQDTSIARLTPPGNAERDGAIRTAANEGFRQ